MPACLPACLEALLSCCRSFGANELWWTVHSEHANTQDQGSFVEEKPAGQKTT